MSALAREYYDGYAFALQRERIRVTNAVVHRLVIDRRLGRLERERAALSTTTFGGRLKWVISGRVAV